MYPRNDGVSLQGANLKTRTTHIPESAPNNSATDMIQTHFRHDHVKGLIWVIHQNRDAPIALIVKGAHLSSTIIIIVLTACEANPIQDAGINAFPQDPAPESETERI